MEQSGDDRVKQVPAAVFLLGGDRGTGQCGKVCQPPGLGDIADHGQGEPARCGPDRAEADLCGEGGPVLAQPDEPCLIVHRPGPGCAVVAGPQAAVPVLQVRWEEELDRVTEYLVTLVAEYRVQPQVRQHDRAVVIGQRHPVLEGINHLPEHGRVDRLAGALAPAMVMRRLAIGWGPPGRARITAGARAAVADSSDG